VERVIAVVVHVIYEGVGLVPDSWSTDSITFKDLELGVWLLIPAYLGENEGYRGTVGPYGRALEDTINPSYVFGPSPAWRRRPNYLDQDLRCVIEFCVRIVDGGVRENGVFHLCAGLDLGSPVCGLIMFLGQVEVLCEDRFPEEDVVSNIEVEGTGCLGNTGDGLWVGQDEDVINDLDRSRLEGAGHGGTSSRGKFRWIDF